MRDSKEIIKKIEHLRGRLYQLIRQNDDLIGTEIICVSQQLDKLINEYNLITSKQIA